MVEVFTITLLCLVLSKVLGKERGADVELSVPVPDSPLEDVEAAVLYFSEVKPPSV